eukprot:Gb_31046 [translate_table: standard]
MGFLQSTMRSRGSSRQPLNLRLLVLGLVLVFILVLALRSITTTTTAPPHKLAVSTGHRLESPQGCIDSASSSSCGKLPSSVAQALIHYAASNITPQQTPPELNIAAGVMAIKSPCNFLVFGLGYDSLLWSTLNHGGRTIFLEEDKDWIAQVARKHPELKAYHVEYSTMVTQAEDLLKNAHSEDCSPAQNLEPETSRCILALKNLPAEIYNTKWDAIMIDAPRGYFPEAPGRMTAIYTAAVMARNRRKKGNTDIFVHDVDRSVEDSYSKAFLCEENLVGFEGRLWHFSVPAKKGLDSFCSAAQDGIRGQKMENSSSGSV